MAKISAKGELLLLAYKLGLRVERTADEWALISDKIILFKGTKEKVLKRIEHIAEVAEKNPKFVMRLSKMAGRPCKCKERFGQFSERAFQRRATVCTR